MSRVLPAGLESAVELANKVVPFATAARLAGADLPPPKASGTRAYCPFGELSHPDEGVEKALRVYPDHAFCFAEWLWLTPVRIFALMNGMDETHAANELLVRYGFTPASYQERWERLSGWQQAPDLSRLAQALRTWLSGAYPDWNARQFDSLVADGLARCLGLLSRVRTEEDCRLWLHCSKQLMAAYMGATRRS